MIKDYTTVSKPTVVELTDAVNSMIQLFGWQPIGGITKHRGKLIQPMVRYTNE